MNKDDLKDKSFKTDQLSNKKEKVQEKGFKWLNKTYKTLRDIPIPISQAERWYKVGKIKKV